MSKEEARYRKFPSGGEKCALCTMFRQPSSCTAVDGNIVPQGWCKLFEKKNA